MENTVKRKIVNLSSSALSIASLFIAVLCFIFRAGSFYLPAKLEKIDLLAIKTVLPRKNFNIPNFSSNNLSLDYQKNNIPIPNGNNNNNTQTKSEQPGDNIKNDMELPQMEDNLQSDEEYHAPNEKTYKIIETHVGDGGTK